jgi:hypothetical protein
MSGSKLILSNHLRPSEYLCTGTDIFQFPPSLWTRVNPVVYQNHCIQERLLSNLPKSETGEIHPQLPTHGLVGQTGK